MRARFETKAPGNLEICCCSNVDVLFSWFWLSFNGSSSNSGGILRGI